MGTFLLVLAIMIAVAVVPVMIAARLVKASNTGFGSALIAVIVHSLVTGAIQKYVEQPWLAFALVAVIGAVLYSAVLGTSFLRGLVISILVAVISALILLLFGAAIIAAVA